MNWKKYLIILLSIFLVIQSPGLSFSATDLQKSQQELKKIQNELNALNKQKREKNNAQKAVVQRMNSIEDNIQSLESEINGIQGKIAGAEKSVELSKLELQLAEQKIGSKNEVLNARLRAMYKVGHIGYLDVLLGSSDFGDMMTRVDMIQRIYHQDTELLRSMKKSRDQVANKKVSLEKYAKELKSLQSNLNVKQNALDGNLDALEVEKVELSKDLKALEQREDQLVEDSNRLTRLLAKMKTTTKYVGGKMAWPVPGNYKISSPYGYRIHPIYKTRKLHTGIDISAPKGTPVVAAQGGTVIMSESYYGYGKTVMIDHGGGYVTLYGHNSSLVVNSGQKVSKGQVIAKVGSTGTSTGNHCHFEVRYKGKTTDPVPWVSK